MLTLTLTVTFVFTKYIGGVPWSDLIYSFNNRKEVETGFHSLSPSILYYFFTWAGIADLLYKTWTEYDNLKSLVSFNSFSANFG